ncbi:hypothetical protein D9M71_471370 [compost metagenome]
MLAVGVVDVAIAGACRIDTGEVGFAAGVADTQLQVRRAQGLQAGLVLQFPGLFTGAVEVGVLHGVVQVEERPIVLGEEIERGVAIDLLQPESK